MFYDTRKKNDHGLPHDPFKAIVAPRPIGWITSMSAAGAINLAPYSWFNGVSSRPPMVMFSSEERKDSLAFIEETREFVCNFATYELREQVNQTSAPFPRGVNEMEKCGLKPAPSQLVKPPRVAASPCALECKWVQTVSLTDCDGQPTDRHVLFGQVIGVYIDERFIRDGLSRFAGRTLALDEDIYASASETNFRNRSIANLLHSLGRLYSDPAEATDLYTRQCSLQVSAKDLAMSMQAHDSAQTPPRRSGGDPAEGERCAPVTASARSEPALMLPIAADMLVNIIGICPPSTSLSAGASPR